MNLYPLALFLHVSGALGICVSVGVWQFGLAALRRAQRVEQVRALAWLILIASPLMVASVLLLGIGGFEMALSTWGLRTPWITVSLGSLVLIGPIGAFMLDPHMRTILTHTREMPDGPLPDALGRQIHRPILVISIHLMTAILFGIVGLMTIKPPLLASILMMGVAAFLGLLVSLPFWHALRRRTKRLPPDVNSAETDPFLKKTFWMRRW